MSCHCIDPSVSLWEKARQAAAGGRAELRRRPNPELVPQKRKAMDKQQHSVSTPQFKRHLPKSICSALVHLKRHSSGRAVGIYNLLLADVQRPWASLGGTRHLQVIIMTIYHIKTCGSRPALKTETPRWCELSRQKTKCF